MRELLHAMQLLVGAETGTVEEGSGVSVPEVRRIALSIRETFDGWITETRTIELHRGQSLFAILCGRSPFQTWCKLCSDRLRGGAILKLMRFVRADSVAWPTSFHAAQHDVDTWGRSLFDPREAVTGHRLQLILGARTVPCSSAGDRAVPAPRPGRGG